MRNFEGLNDDSKVKQTYEKMYQEQTIEKVLELQEIYSPGNHGKYTIIELLDMLGKVIDESDPDTGYSQDIHGYQTAERIREMYFKDDVFINPYICEVFDGEEICDEYKGVKFGDYYPEFDWNILSLIGLIHDLGKVLALPEFGMLNQHFLVGDTYPLGFSIDNNVVFKELADQYQTIIHDEEQFPGIGFDNLLFSFSHDNYLANVLKYTNLPEEALYIIRYHSFYPWVKPKYQRGYTKLASIKDWYMLPLVKLFQKADLYSKVENLPDMNKIKEYYGILIDKYLPGYILF